MPLAISSFLGIVMPDLGYQVWSEQGKLSDKLLLVLLLVTSIVFTLQAFPVSPVKQIKLGEPTKLPASTISWIAMIFSA